MKKGLVCLGGLFLSLVILLGTTGCKSVEEWVAGLDDVATDEMDTASYANEYIDVLNEVSLSRGTFGGMFVDAFERHLVSIEADATTCSLVSSLSELNQYSKDRILEVKAEDEEVESTLKPMFERYVEDHQVLVEASSALKGYCMREAYKDDGGAEIESLTNAVSKAYVVVVVDEDALYAKINEVQDGVETDFADPDTTDDPVEFVIAVTHKMTAEAEDLVGAYYDWSEKVLAGEDADISELKIAREEFNTDYEKYSARSEEVGANDLSSSGYGIKSYWNNMKEIDAELEIRIRDWESGELTAEGLLEIELSEKSVDNGLFGAYDDVVEDHNDLMDSIQNDSGNFYY